MEIIAALYSFVSAIFFGALIAGQKVIKEMIRTSQENQKTLSRVETDVKEILTILKAVPVIPDAKKD